MKLRYPILLLAFICATQLPLKAQGPVCENDSTGLIPLIDLGPGMYLGYQGGLFPGGSNTEATASQHYKKGRSFAKNMQPLDSLGNVNYGDGVVLMGGFGPSVVGSLFDEFVPIVRDTVDGYITNRCFDAINLSAGGKGLDFATGIDSTKYWNNLLGKIIEKGYTPEQLQVAFMYFSNKTDTTGMTSFPETPLEIRDSYEFFLRMLLDRFPNVKIVFISGRHYGGYCDTTMEQANAIEEPISYWNSFSVKWLIQDQITGDPNLRYFGANKRVPFIIWGPYYWTDGAEPRATDGRFYVCEDFSETDGYHLMPDAYVEDADYLMQHIYNSDFSRYYVRNDTKWIDCIPYNDSIYRSQPDLLPVSATDWLIYPNPATDLLHVYLPTPLETTCYVSVFDPSGICRYTEEAQSLQKMFALDIASLNPGMYVLRIAQQLPDGRQQIETKTFIKME